MCKDTTDIKKQNSKDEQESGSTQLNESIALYMVSLKMNQEPMV